MPSCPKTLRKRDRSWRLRACVSYKVNKGDRKRFLDNFHWNIRSWTTHKLMNFLMCKLRSKRRVSSDHAGMKNISGEVSISCLWTNSIHLVTCNNSVSRIITVATRWTKSVYFTFSITFHTGGLAKNHFLAWGDAKKENWRTTKLFLKHVS